MIKIERFKVFNFDNAIRGMRNPMNSWSESDSYVCDSCCEDCCGYDAVNDMCMLNINYVVGSDDMKLMQKLYKAGTEHSKYLRQIFVSMQITAPLFWWKEMDTYRIGTVINSCSTMHTLHKRALTLDDFSTDGVSEDYKNTLQMIIDVINGTRLCFEESNDKKLWREMIMLLPSSFNQTRMWTGSYANLTNIIKQRNNHKLSEWHEFIYFIQQNSPYLLTLMSGAKEK